MISSISAAGYDDTNYFKKGSEINIERIGHEENTTKNDKSYSIPFDQKQYLNEVKNYSLNDLSFSYHMINDGEINRLRDAFSIETSKNKNSNQQGLLWGDENKDELIESTKIVDSTYFDKGSLPSSKDLSATPYFPEVKSQGLQGSCAAWAITYYSYGFLEAKDQGWTDASNGNPKHLMSPSWTYNKVTCTEDISSIRENAEIIMDWGVSSLYNCSYNQSDINNWGNESAFRESVEHRGEDFFYLGYDENNTITDLKNLLNSEIPVTLSIDSRQFSECFSDGNYVISSKEYERNYPDHSNTIVGYDDDISDDGEEGAFKVVNSWGKSFGDDGYYWLTYDTLEEMGILSNLQYITDKIDYQPSLVATCEVDKEPPRMGDISLDNIDDRGVSKTKKFYYREDPNFNNTFPSFMCFDVSKFSDRWDEGKDADSFSLNIDSPFGEISSFKMEYYEDKYIPYHPDYISEESSDTPSPTSFDVKVDFYGPSHIATTVPNPRSTHVTYGQNVLVTFTESMDTNIIPELKQIGGLDPGGWEFEEWYSVKNKNDTAVWSHNPWNIMENITLKISGYVNETGVEGEPYQWYFKTDTYDPIIIGSNSDFAKYADDYGWSGDGSQEDPWLIENIEIDGESNSSCVYISGTDDYFIIRNSIFHNANIGINLDRTSNGIIQNNTITNVGTGINLIESINIDAINNNIKIERISNQISGIYSSKSNDNRFIDNYITSDISNRTYLTGIEISSSDDNIIQNNTIDDHYTSIRIYRSNQCKIKDNKIKNETVGLNIIISTGMRVINNSFSRCGINLFGRGSYGEPKKYFTTHEIKSNTIDGKPIIYYENKSDMVIDDDIGELILIYCSNITVKDIDLDLKPGIIIHSSKDILVKNTTLSFDYYNERNYGFYGISVGSTENISIKNCLLIDGAIWTENISESLFYNNTIIIKEKNNKMNESFISVGIVAHDSQNLTVKKNTITETDYGMYFFNLTYSKVIENTISFTTNWGMFFINITKNFIYHNNFYMDEDVSGYRGSAGIRGYTEEEVIYYDWVDKIWPVNNTWDDGYPQGGNYWSDLDKKDTDGDGIIDTPYYIESNQEKDRNVDRYPLADPFYPRDIAGYPQRIISANPRPNSYNVSLDQEIKIVLNGSLNTSDTPKIEQINGNQTTGLQFLGFSDTNTENDTVTWSHDEWDMGEKISLKLSSYSFLYKGTNDSYSFSFKTYEEQPPVITDISAKQIKVDENYTFLAKIDDDSAIDKAKVDFWFDGNKTTLPLYNIYENMYKMKVKTPINATHFKYIIRAVDTSGNVFETEIKNYTLIDDIPPVIKIKEIDRIQVFENVTFNASESHDNIGIKDFYWDIDGEKFNKSTVTRSFSKVGKIIVTVSVVDYSGNMNSRFMVLTVNDYIKPVARAGGNKTVNVDERIKLDASNSTDNYGIREYIWNFNNNTYISKTINYTFKRIGTYRIQLTVVDITGNEGITNVTYTVKDLEPPHADAGGNITAKVGETLTLDGSNSTDNYYIYQYLWKIDGSVYKGEKLEHTFDKSGVYDVTLEVIDISQNTDEDNITVIIEPYSVKVGPVIDQDGHKLEGVKVNLTHNNKTLDNGNTDKNGTVIFEIDFNPDDEEFDLILSDDRFEESKKFSFNGSESDEISVKTIDKKNGNGDKEGYQIPIIIASIAVIVLIILWIYRKKSGEF